MLYGLLRVGERKQIMKIATPDARPTKVIGDPTRPCEADQSIEFIEVVGIERIARADIQGHAMHGDGRELSNLRDDSEGPAARHHVVLRQQLEPVDTEIVSPSPFEYVGVMDRAQTDAYTQEGSVGRAPDGAR
jgi:hypothetical protein